MGKQEASNVTSIAVARHKREEASDTAPLEAFAPQITRIQREDYLLSACDGEQSYVWFARKGKTRKTFQVVEVYPGLDKKRTAFRDATEAKDLVLTLKCDAIEAVRQALEDLVFEDLEACDAE